MAEDFLNLDPAEIGRRIVANYLSKRGWSREWRKNLDRQIYPAFQREELEEKERKCDQAEDEAEEILSREVEKWRHATSPQAKEVLRTILQLLEPRNDLGFFGKRIVEYLRRNYS